MRPELGDSYLPQASFKVRYDLFASMLPYPAQRHHPQPLICKKTVSEGGLTMQTIVSEVPGWHEKVEGCSDTIRVSDEKSQCGTLDTMC